MNDKHTSAGRRRGWKQWSEAEARKALRAWEASGTSAKSFAAGKGFSAQRLLNWKRRLSSTPATSSAFVAVELAADTRTRWDAITIEHGPVTLRVPCSYSTEAIARLVHALSSAERC